MTAQPKAEVMHQMTLEFQQMVDDYFTVQCRYQSAIREVQTKLEILDSEFETKHKRNPIHHMQSRLKSIQSIWEKMARKGFPMNIAAATENLTDIAGIRVVCSYVDDVYNVARILAGQDDVKVLRVRDYIKEPKENGYRSLHLVIETPVFLAEGKIIVPVEVQLRTIAMDLWASLEHQLRYKGLSEVPADISAELMQTASDLAQIDDRMQNIHDRVSALRSENQK